MADATERFVPKVHPATRAVEPEDPFTLRATPVGGDPEVMLRCVVQEYAWMGWDAEQILGLFYDPFYPALNALLDHYGEAGIRERVSAVLCRSGVLRFAATVCDAASPEECDDHDHEPDIVQIQIPAGLSRERPLRRSESAVESAPEPHGTAQRPFPTRHEDKP